MCHAIYMRHMSLNQPHFTVEDSELRLKTPWHRGPPVGGTVGSESSVA